MHLRRIVVQRPLLVAVVSFCEHFLHVLFTDQLPLLVKHLGERQGRRCKLWENSCCSRQELGEEERCQLTLTGTFLGRFLGAASVSEARSYAAMAAVCSLSICSAYSSSISSRFSSCHLLFASFSRALKSATDS